MSLVTVLRSPSSENTSTCTDSELEEDVEDGSPRSRTSSFEGFFTSKGSAFALPDGDFARKASKHGGEMQMHLQSMVNLLRDDDVLRLVVKLEGACKDRVRYLTVISAFNEDDIEESIAIGIDWVNKRATCSIGMVLPLWRDTKIELDGDGGFKLSTNYRRHILKPVSVQTMWTAVQWIHRCAENARKNNQFPNGLSHQWSNFYASHISSDQQCINEWYEMEDISSKLIQLPTGTSPEQELMMKLIRHKLKEVMMKVDLEEVTSRMIRQNLEDEMQMELKEYKQYIDEEMLSILGQMDSASQIYDHVYLGSEWNASNLEELRENGVGYILNISREIDNFFYGTFEYLNIRVYDTEESDLLPHWNKTHKFMNDARESGAKVLVHCKMGMSRSASTVIAYGMKEYGTSLHDTMKDVKAKRSVICPNAGFWKQLITYEGILNSSKQRYNKLFASPGRRRTNSDDSNMRTKGVKRRRNRRNQKSKTVTIGEKHYPKPVVEEAHASTLEQGMFIVGEHDDDDPFQEPETGQPSSMESSSSAEEVLRTWEKSLSDSTEGSPSNSRPTSPEHGLDEIDDTVGVLERPVSKSKGNKVPSLHRARSVPILIIGETTTSPDDQSTDTDSREELHRCTSLHEFLSGKVQKLKEDFKVHTTARNSGSIGTLERKSSSHPTSPVGEFNEENIDEKVIKIKLHSTLSDPTNVVTDRSVISDVVKGSIVEESDKNDVGSVPDQTHAVVHRDAQGLVKSGTVKRQSRNFEEGRVNLPWEWEKALEVLEKSENSEMKEVSEDSPAPSYEPEGLSRDVSAAEDEPPAGVVKMHAQKFQGKFDGEGTEIDSEEDIDDSNKDQESDKDTNTFVAEAGCPNVEISKAQDDQTKEETQRTRESFEKEVKKVNEDMVKEKSNRRDSTKRKSEVDFDEKIDPILIDIQESENVSKENDSEESSHREDPLPGTVKKHTQEFEGKHQKLTSSADSCEDISSKKTEPDSVTDNVSPKKIYRFLTNVEPKTAEAEPSTSQATDPNEDGSFDVDVLLRRVNEDMQREREQRRVNEGFKDYVGFSLEESMFIDIEPQTENTDILQEQDDESEIPRPGIVKRNTEILLGKGKVTQESTEKKVPAKEDEPTVTLEEAMIERSPEVKVSSRKGTMTGEKDEESEKPNTDSDSPSGKGLVKRHTLVYEGVIPFPTDGDSVDDSQSNVMEPEVEEKSSEEDPKTRDEETSEESCSGTVKRHTLIFEGKCPNDETERSLKSMETLTSSDSGTLETKQLVGDYEQEEEPQTQENGEDAEQDTVDTSSVVKVKLRLQLLEDVIREANVRENHRQRTTKALADLEDKRKQIEMEQNKLDSESSVHKQIDPCSTEVEDRPSQPEVTTIVSSQERMEAEVQAEQEPESPTKDNPDEVTPCVGNVRLRTLQLEERIHGGQSVGKSRPSLRRHESMPRITRPVDRPVVRQRSMSDIEVRSNPSTSRASVASSSSLVCDMSTDKNRGPYTEESRAIDDTPDNDRDSEKLSDDMSENSDKTDDDLTTKSSDIFELGDQNIELSNSKDGKILEKDNKDMHTLS